MDLRRRDPHALEREHQHRIAGEASQRGEQRAVALRIGAAEHALGEQERVEATASGPELHREHRGEQGLGIQEGSAAETGGDLVGVLRKLVVTEHLGPQIAERWTHRFARFPDPNRAQHQHGIRARHSDVGLHVSVQRKVAEQIPQGPEAPRGVLRLPIPQREGKPPPGRGQSRDGVVEIRELPPVSAGEARQEARRVRRARPHDGLPAGRRRAPSRNDDPTLTDPQAPGVATEGLETVAVAIERRQGARRVIEKGERLRIQRREREVQAGGVRPRRHASEQARRKLARLDRRGGSAVHVGEQQLDPEVRRQRKPDGEGRNLEPQRAPAVQQVRDVIDGEALMSQAGAEGRSPPSATAGRRSDPMPAVDLPRELESEQIEECCDRVALRRILHRGEAEAPPEAGLQPCGLHGAQVVQVGDQRRPRAGIRAAPVKGPHQLPDEAGPAIRPRIQAGRAPDATVRSRHGHLEPAFRLRRRRLGARKHAEYQYQRGYATCHGILGHRHLPRLTTQRHGAPCIGVRDAL